MQSCNEFLFLRFSAPVSGVPRHAIIKPLIQCVKVVDLKNENAVKKINKAVEISAAAAEEGDCDAVIGDHGFDFVYIPKQMLLLPYGLVHLALVGRFTNRFPRLWIAPIFQFPVTMDNVVTAPLQFFGYRGFASAGHAFNQIIFNTHCR